MNFLIAMETYVVEHKKQAPSAAVIPVFITGRPIITEWGDNSTFNIPTVILRDI